MNFRQKIAIAVIDTVVLGELALSIYMANQDPENFTLIFFKCFFGLLVPTLVMARVIVKMLRTRETSAGVSD